MDIHTYLTYNNIALIDPSNDFHASCINFYNARGYLSIKQLGALRSYCFSADDISRLASSSDIVEPVKAVEAPEVVTYKPTPTPAGVNTTTAKVKKVKKVKKKVKKPKKSEYVWDEIPF